MLRRCYKCRTDIPKDGHICPKCGTDFESFGPKDAITAIIGSIIIPLGGIVLGIQGLMRFREPKTRKKFIAAIVLSLVMAVVWLAITAAANA